MNRKIIGGEPVEISRCATRVPYGLAEFLGVISNLKFTLKNENRNSLLKNNSEITIPTFYNYHSINIKSANFKDLIEKETTGFCFWSGITSVLLEIDKINNQEEEVKKRRHSIIIGTKRENLEVVRNILTPLFKNPRSCLPTGGCPRRRLCPIDVSSRHRIFLKRQENWGKKIPDRFGDHCLCNCPWEIPLDLPLIDPNSYAQIAVCGYGGERYGALAMAINLLVFRDNVEPRNEKAEYVIDEKSERSFGCFHPYRNYYKFYGNIAKWEWEKDEEKNEIIQNSFINAVLIRPATEEGFKIWQNYAKLIFNFISKSWPCKYLLFVSTDRNIILLFRYRKELFDKIDNALKAYFNKLKNTQDGNQSFFYPDLFLYALRGYKRRGETVWDGICTERKTACPFEKVQDESRTYKIKWQRLDC